MSAQTALFIAADLVFVALLILMARIYFYGLRLAAGVLNAILAIAAGSFFVFVAAMFIDDAWAWAGPTCLSAVLVIAAMLAPSSKATKGLVPSDASTSPNQEQALGIMQPPAEPEVAVEAPLDYRHFVLDRETNMFLHRPDGDRTIACYVSWLSAPGDAQLTLDDLVNRAENHVCHVARVPAVA